MDPEMQELKKLVQESLELSRDTNRIVHGMRRSARWGIVMRFVYWAVILGVTAGAYYLYVMPFVEQFERMYATLQSTGMQASEQSGQLQSFLDNLRDSIGQYIPQKTQ